MLAESRGGEERPAKETAMWASVGRKQDGKRGETRKKPIMTENELIGKLGNNFSEGNGGPSLFSSLRPAAYPVAANVGIAASPAEVRDLACLYRKAQCPGYRWWSVNVC